VPVAAADAGGLDLDHHTVGLRGRVGERDQAWRGVEGLVEDCFHGGRVLRADDGDPKDRSVEMGASAPRRDDGAAAAAGTPRARVTASPGGGW
jgi:hypothetical protein